MTIDILIDIYPLVQLNYLVPYELYSVSQCLEAYLMWLFGYIMFNSHSSTVNKLLMSYTLTTCNTLKFELERCSNKKQSVMHHASYSLFCIVMCFSFVFE
jgi:hypothetical protein